MNLKGTKVTLHDMSLRDGMHAKRHQITLDEMIDVAQEMEKKNVNIDSRGDRGEHKLVQDFGHQLYS